MTAKKVFEYSNEEIKGVRVLFISMEEIDPVTIRDRAMKLDSLGNFVPLYLSLRCTFLLPLFPGATDFEIAKIAEILTWGKKPEKIMTDQGTVF